VTAVFYRVHAQAGHHAAADTWKIFSSEKEADLADRPKTKDMSDI